VIHWRGTYTLPGKDQTRELEMVPGTHYFPPDSEAGGWRCHYEAVEENDRGKFRMLGCIKDGHWARTGAMCSERGSEYARDYPPQDESYMVIGFRDDRGEGGQMIVKIECWTAAIADPVNDQSQPLGRH
jgi:hypothetical protein